jgi:hypothetical protein
MLGVLQGPKVLARDFKPNAPCVRWRLLAGDVLAAITTTGGLHRTSYASSIASPIIAIAPMSSSKILASPLPPPPGGDPLTTLQWTTFLAIADTVIASVRPAMGTSNLNERCVPEHEYQNAVGDYRRSVADAVDDAVLEKFFGEKLTDVDVFQPLLRRIMLEYVKPDAVRGMAIFLDLLKYA